MSDETTILPVAIHRTDTEVTFEMDAESLMEAKDDERIGTIKLAIDGHVVALFQRFTTAQMDQMRAAARDYASGVIPDLTDDEIDKFMTAADEPQRLAAAITAALVHSVKHCTDCKVCENQVTAVMDVLGYEPDV